MVNNKDSKEIPVEFLEEQDVKATDEMNNHSNPAADKTETPRKMFKKSKDEHKKKKDEYKIKYQELNEQFLRFRAEFANYKKRVEKEQIEFADYIKGEIVKKILPILDDFDHMMQKSNGEENEQSVIEGAKMIYEKLFQSLKEYGVEKVEALGKEFDPQVHEALMMQKISDKENNGKVVSVFQEGYKLRDRLLRPSKVVVGEYDDAGGTDQKD